jgi:hypothetical protein
VKAQIIYLNRYLNCPDSELRQNYAMQDKINEAKAVFWHDIKELGINQYQANLCYDRFIHSNRDRLKLVDNNQGLVD